jgi:hypothetical protein
VAIRVFLVGPGILVIVVNLASAGTPVLVAGPVIAVTQVSLVILVFLVGQANQALAVGLVNLVSVVNQALAVYQAGQALAV